MRYSKDPLPEEITKEKGSFVVPVLSILLLILLLLGEYLIKLHKHVQITMYNVHTCNCILYIQCIMYI